MSSLFTISTLLLACFSAHWAGLRTPLAQCPETDQIRGQLDRHTAVWILAQDFDSGGWRLGWKFTAESVAWCPYAAYIETPDLSMTRLVFAIDKNTAPTTIFALNNGSMELVISHA